MSKKLRKFNRTAEHLAQLRSDYENSPKLTMEEWRKAHPSPRKRRKIDTFNPNIPAGNQMGPRKWRGGIASSPMGGKVKVIVRDGQVVDEGKVSKLSPDLQRVPHAKP